MNFERFRFHPEVAAGVRATGYTTPTPIQTEGIPPILEGKDLVGLAQTGTGKTAAFVLPILDRLVRGKKTGVRALIVVPTRELAVQIHDAVGDLGRRTGLRSITLFGGVALHPQIEKLRRGPDIVVACPGRLLDHIDRGTIDVSGLEVLVLDEADQMLDMGFLPDIRKILRHVPSRRQTLLFSATMPREIQRLAQSILTKPLTVRVGDTAPATTVSHALFPIAGHLKTELLLMLLKQTDTESVLVFTRTKHRAKRLAAQMERAGFKAASLQGNLSQNRRQAVMNGFRDGTFRVLVATDIASRGLDVRHVSHVINYDIPGTADAYIHRIGRTGRATRSGDAFTLITREDTDTVRLIERVMGSPIERRTVDGFNYDAPLGKKGQPSHGQRPARRASSPSPGSKAARKKPRRSRGKRAVPSASATATASRKRTPSLSSRAS